MLETWVTSQFFLLFYLWDSLLFQRPPHLLYCLTCPGPPAAAFLGILSAWLPVSSPPTGLDECFFFNSLVYGLPYSSIFCQFWLFFCFEICWCPFWLCEEAQCVHLCLHLGQKSS